MDIACWNLVVSQIREDDFWRSRSIIVANFVVAFESQKAGEVLGGHYLSFKCGNSS
jgi:hypothetical protein